MTTFRVWAPRQDRMRIVIAGVTSASSDAGQDAGESGWEMTPRPEGWWSIDVLDLAAGTDYAFQLGDDDTEIPDPRSPRQPAGVHARSRTYDHTDFTWADEAWTGRPLAGGVIYEAHVGTFTSAGTFDAMAARLDHLVALGVEFLELLPVNAFNGTHNWGYDGVGWYAVHEPYGGPDGLKRLVDACHARGIAVLLDVVYNHLGPSGNYLDRFGPYFSDVSNPHNPWGRSINLDGPGCMPVRRHIIDNAIMWLRDYHVDGLRLDAVHALVDTSAIHLLEELATEVDALAAHLQRPLTLVAESDLGDPRLVTPRQAGGYGLDAQWSDDFHHALHAALTGERQGYYVDFGELSAIAKVLIAVFFHNGTWSTFRDRRHGRPVPADTGRWRFVGFLQDHDQVGNRAAGDRISATLSPGLLKVGATLLLTSPFTPMLFMGEEWGASTPWQFFTSHPEPELASAVAAGRRAEFQRHGWSEAASVPDPQDPATFRRSKLDWGELAADHHADILTFYQRLISLRRRHPELTDPRAESVSVRFDEAARWIVVRRGRLAIVANLAAARQAVPVPAPLAPSGVLLSSDRAFVYSGEHVELAAESALVLAVSALAAGASGR